jgi:hypothetical protein
VLPKFFLFVNIFQKFANIFFVNIFRNVGQHFSPFFDFFQHFWKMLQHFTEMSPFCKMLRHFLEMLIYLTFFHLQLWPPSVLGGALDAGAGPRRGWAVSVF